MITESDAEWMFWVVRLLGGAPQRQDCPVRQPHITIGYALDNDIVIRDPAAKGRRAALDFREGSAARLQVLAGEISILGQDVTAPAAALWPPYTPLSLGKIQLAYGAPDHPRWGEAERLAKAITSDADGEGPGSVPDPPAAIRTRASSRFGAPILLILAALSTGIAMLGTNVSPHGLAHASPVNMRPNLPPTNILASRAEALFLSEGIPVTAMADNRGDVTISAPQGADPLQVDRVRRQLMREVRSAKRVDLMFGPAAPSDAPAESSHMVAAVAGPDGYLIAADGSKYFPGAALPTGQTLKSIDNGAIALDEDGVTTWLDLQNKGGTR